jgi:pimeloyl-ACP methyl ester carboxylesterase
MRRSARHQFSTFLFVALAVAGFAVPEPASSQGIGCDEIHRVRASENVVVDDAPLYLLTRGEDCTAPILLWLHGGPGAAERPLFRLYNRELEHDFIVAYWDQRGAGRSWDPDADPDTLTVRRHLQDLDQIVAHLRRQLPDRDVILVGHSWGAALGILYAAESPDLISAVVAVNPLIDGLQSQIAQAIFVADEAERRGDIDARATLRSIGSPPLDGSGLLEMQGLVGRYGGDFHNRPNFVGATVSGMLRGYVSPVEIATILRANTATLAAMADDVAAINIGASVATLDVPILFLLGRHDRILDPGIAIEFFDQLDARNKDVVWFEGSAHNIPFEEPEAFNLVLRSFRATMAEQERGSVRP